jgi:peptidoglycan/LPS O-acetylase OafA/YrhL
MVVTKMKWGYLPATLHDLTLNFLLLFGLVPGKHESIVWAGWSIGVEIIFYLFFPLVASIINSLRIGILVVAIAILVSSSFYSAASTINIGSYSYLNIITHLPTFLSGVLGYLIWHKTGFIQNKVIGGGIMLVALVSALCVIYLPATYGVLSAIKGVRLDLYVWSIIFMMLILSVCIWPNKLVTNATTTTLGKISFSLYLWHPLIVITLLDVYLLIGLRLGGGLKNFLACASVTLGAVTLVAFISYRFIEMPGMAYGKKITNSL